MLTKFMAAAVFAAASTLTFTGSSSAFAANDSSLLTDHWLASDVYGAGVYDPKENKIGDVDDLVINREGAISNAVIGVGGFLGVDKKDVAIPFADLKVTTKNDKSWLVLDTTKDKLKAAPAFDKNDYDK
jgi:sporulation protein YlmC with PRC-barrel domain